VDAVSHYELFEELESAIWREVDRELEREMWQVRPHVREAAFWRCRKRLIDHLVKIAMGEGAV